MSKSQRKPKAYEHQIATIRRRAPLPAGGHLLRLDELAMSAGQIVGDLYPLPDNEATLDEHIEDLGKLVDLLAPIEDEAATHKAMTPRATLFQLLLAVADLHEMIDTNDDEAVLRQRHRRVARYVESAIDFIEAETGIDREEIGGRYFAPRRQSSPSLLRKPD